MAKSLQSRAMESLIEHLETYTVTQGEGAGGLFQVLPWERDFIRKAFVPEIRIAALSMARGGGKSTFIGGIAASGLHGPLEGTRADVVIISGILSQARIVFGHSKSFLGLKDSTNAYRVVDNTTIAEITRLHTGSRLRALASNPDFAHGLAPLLVICDEPAKWQAQTSQRMWTALRTSLGKIPGAKILVIGTRPEDPLHWFSKLLDSPPSDAYSRVYMADKDCAIDDEAQWVKANPSLPFMPTLLAAYRAECLEAMGDPESEAEFRALRLNLGTPEVEDRDVLVGVDVWKQCRRDGVTCEGPYVMGLDLGGSQALSGAAGFWPRTHQLRVMAACGDVPDPVARGKKDGVGALYANAVRARDLLLTPGRVADVGMLLEACFLYWGKPLCIVCDTYRQAELLDVLEKRGWDDIDVVLRSPGYRDASEDVKLFRDEVEGFLLRAPKSDLLDHHMGRAVVQTDTAGHVKLAKKASSGRNARTRDDLAAATIIGVAQGVRVGSDVEAGNFCGVA